MKNCYPYNIFAVIVLYNKTVSESVTAKNLVNLNVPGLQLIVVDNSINPNNNEILCRQKGIQYFSMHGNKGLSKAYNFSLNYITSVCEENDIVIWLDDDTNISGEYFRILNEALLSENNADVFVPFIKGQNDKIYSPNSKRFLKNKLLQSVNDTIETGRFNAINSCLAVKLHIYKNYRYDEHLFLDSVDENFFEDLRKMDVRFHVLHTIIQQNFFQREKQVVPSYLKQRMKIRVIDLMAYSRKKITYTLLGVIKALGWGVQLGWKYKSFSVLITCFKYSLLGFINNITSTGKKT